MADKPICSIPGCDKPIKKRGWCSKHYYELRDGPQCSVAGCSKPAKARSLCNAHWRRWKRHGNPCAGGTPSGVPLDYLKNVVLLHDKDECLTWPFTRDSNGYGRIKGRPVNRLVCEHKHGPAPTTDHQAAHSCGKGHLGCCAKAHLSWKTRSENEADKLIHGTDKRGSRHHNAKLTASNVHYIRSMRGKTTGAELAVRFGVSPATISGIQTKNGNWSWLE